MLIDPSMSDVGHTLFINDKREALVAPYLGAWVEWSVPSGLFSSGLLHSLEILLHLSASSVLTENQNMVSDQTSAPSSNDGIIPASTTPATGGSGDNYSPGLNADSPPQSVSDVASSSHQYPPNSPASSIPDPAAVRGATSSGHHSSIDENDIVIAYVCLALRFIALIMLSTRVMGPTGAGKSSVSYWCKDSTLHMTETFTVC
jgi:hypothetical protein